MVAQNERNSICAELDLLLLKFEEYFDDSDAEKCAQLLRQSFSEMRRGDAYNILQKAELEGYVGEWTEAFLRFSHLSPYRAFCVARDARDMCRSGDEKLPCDILLVNTACVGINSLAYPAFRHYMRNAGYLPVEQFSLFIEPVIHVLITTSAHFRSSQIQDTFYEALTLFENMLYSHMLPPVSRYSVAKKVRDWADAQKPNCGALLSRMEEILQDATFLPNGQGMIQHPLEVQADQFAAEHETNIRVEESQSEQKCQVFEDRLFSMFQSLSDEEDDEVNSIHLVKLTEKLTDLSLKNAFHLATRCILAMEENPILSDLLQKTVCTFSAPIIARWERTQHGDYTATHKLNLAMMKRTSAFGDEKKAADIFKIAVSGYREYLRTIDPTQRYDELFQISLWVREQASPHEILKQFVDDLMGRATFCGVFLGIPLEGDEEKKVPVANIYKFPQPPEHTPVR